MACSYPPTSFDPFSLEGESDPTASSPKSANHFRRSISIFSRKGAETPEPTLPFFSQSAMRRPRVLSQRQKSWMGRRKSVSESPKSPKPCDSKASKGLKSTVLHSVPPARTIYMTALQEEMASSPNEEIVSAISEHAPTMQALEGNTHPLSKITWKSQSTTSLTQRTKSTVRREKNTRIGEWRDGVVRWDQPAPNDVEEAIVQDTGFTRVEPVRMSSKMGARLVPKRPHLTVAIPGAPLPRNGERTIPSILQPKIRRVIPSVSSVGSLSKDSSKRSSRNVSPIEPEQDLQLPIMKLPERPRNSVQSKKVGSSASRSSTISSHNSVSERTSMSSRRSSNTSIDEQNLIPVLNTNKALPALPALPKEQKAHLAYIPYRPSMHLRLPTTPNLTKPVLLEPTDKVLRPSRSFGELEARDRSFLNSSPYLPSARGISPTLSQAEQDLHEQLDSIPAITQALNQDRTDSVLASSDESCVSSPDPESANDSEPIQTLARAPSRAPTIPRRSRKREWRVSKKGSLPVPTGPVRRRSESQLKATQQTNTTALRKAASVLHGDRTSVPLPALERPQPSRHTSRSSLSDIILNETSNNGEYSERAAKLSEKAYSTSSAENVLLNILFALNSTQDLFNTATISKGMYKIYKTHEMELLRQVVYNESAPAWELREWTPPVELEVSSAKTSSPVDYTPITYVSSHRRDMQVIESLKLHVLSKCQSFMRRDTAFALSTSTHPKAARFNDAFWRIWCFCQIFGSNKGREDDITGQLDWLKGGILATNQDCAATVNTNLEFEMSSVLLNPPDHFARCNASGLSAAQLFDMTELWTCMTVLLQGYHGRVDQAREYGVFDGTDAVQGDTDKEEQVLEEWTFYLLTLGPAVILEMAELAADKSSAGFALAKQNGWTSWTTPSYGGSRAIFLREPVAKSYEAQVAATKLMMQCPLETDLKERSRQRVASLAAEIKIRRQSSAYKRLPFIDMKNERAMSIMSRRGSNASSAPSSRRTTSLPFTPLSPASLWSGPRHVAISPIAEERSGSSSQSAAAGYPDYPAPDTTERAVQRIVAMGFLPHKAREALRVTDMGNGLNIDRAVSWLLKNN